MWRLRRDRLSARLPSIPPDPPTCRGLDQYGTGRPSAARPEDRTVQQPPSPTPSARTGHRRPTHPGRAARTAGRVLAASVALLGASLGSPAGAATAAGRAPARRAASATTPVTDPTPTQPIGHQGRWLTDASGRVVLLHGVNYVSKVPGATPEGDGFGADDAAWLADNGFDVVRLGTTASSIMPTPGVIDTAYVQSFADTVNELTSQGLLVLVDLHQDGWGPSLGDDGFPAWMTITHGATDTHTTFPLYYVTNPAIQAAFQSFWGNEPGPGAVPLQSQVAAIWSALAAKVGGNPGVLGYDLINEPWPGTTWQPCAADPAGCPVQDAAGLDAYDSRMTAAIRAQDPTHLLFPEPYVLFNFGTAPTNITLPGGDANSGLSWHMYTLDTAKEPSVISNADAWAAKTGGALLNTEFGATSDPVAINRQIGELDDALQPWIWWAYGEEIVKDLHQAPTEANLNQPAVSAIVRPHPVAVAGTPTALHYDTGAKALTFSYRTTRAGGGSFACGTVTSLQVPLRSYPSGYHVTVTGGAVTSPAGSAHLTVVARPGATSVTVVVRPGGSTAPSSATALCAASATTPAGGGPTTTVAAPPAEAVQAEPTFTG
jgi:endoglycosylceramidase